ncbi:MAG: ATP-binding protein [Candidatus Jordarchaeum sp.]|uniref:ATP-binding protein n=1 Tax=Candidatus Jordarchaeum sp. TaxID=2823881 RepID=UPI004049FC5C
MLERGRPLCELLTELLQNVSQMEPVTTLEKAYLLNSYVLAQKATERKFFQDQINSLAGQLVSLQSDSGAWLSGSGKVDNEATATIVHAFRIILKESENEQLRKSLESSLNYALSQESADLNIAKILYEGYRYKEDEKFLDKMVELISVIDTDKRVEVFLLLLIATDRMEYLEKALKITKPLDNFSSQETVDFLIWNLSGFDVDRYPKQLNLRKYIAEQISIKGLKDLWWAFAYIVGEASMISIERENLVEVPKIVDTPITVLKDNLGESIILGRSKATQSKLGCKGTFYIGCVGERKSDDKHLLGCKVLLDGVKPHVVFISGHRGSGKSYTMGVIAEELAESRLGIATVLVDPMGIFWSMKYPNWEKRELESLDKWNLSPKGYDNVKVFIPIGFYDKVPEQTKDAPFSLRPSELTADDWCHTFSIERFSTLGLLTEQVIEKVKNGYKASIDDREVDIPGKGDNYTIDDLIICIENSTDIISEDRGFRRDTRRALIARFSSAKQWGVFSAKGTSLMDLAAPNQVSVIDVSQLDDSLRALVIGILARRILKVRSQISRIEEASQLGEAVDEKVEAEIPVTWLMIDEAHLLAPSRGVTAASDPLIDYAKLGRKPGCGLVLVTQQPSATDSRILSQLDILITHYLSYEPDINAFIKRSPAEVPLEVKDSGFLRNIPIGTTIVSDESITSNRALVVKIRPRLSQHSGREALPKMVEEPASIPSKPLKTLEKMGLIPEEIETTSEIEVEAYEALEELKEKEMIEIRPDLSIPPPPVISVPTDIASDYLERILEYRFYDHLYPLPKMERTKQKILTQADSAEVIREVYNKLREGGWQTEINTSKDVPVITGSKDKSRLVLGVLENEENTIVVISSTSVLRNDAVNAITLLKEVVNSLKKAPRKSPKPKLLLEKKKIEEELPELPAPPSRSIAIIEERPEPEIHKPLEKPTIAEQPEEIEIEQKSSKEQEKEMIIKEVQKFQKYLRSLHEYYELGRMTEDEYIFLKRKTFEKIEQLRRSLID